MSNEVLDPQEFWAIFCPPSVSSFSIEVGLRQLIAIIDTLDDNFLTCEHQQN